MNMVRNTKQRKVILEELMKVASHPTAEEIYFIVKKKLPKISIATVYRNLELMASDGTIKRLETRGKQRRYDGRTDNHLHVQCRICDKVEDVDAEEIAVLEKELRNIAEKHLDFTEIDYHVEFIGICKNCQKL
jgi:Fur family ferric uptake transcriptional regulator